MTPARAPKVSIADALQDSRLFEPHFRGSSWNRWRATLKAAFGEQLSDVEREIFQAVAGRAPPTHRVRELVCAVGRGGGKDSVASLIAPYIALNFDPKRAKLRPGELAYILCLAVDKAQASIVFNYIAALFENVPTLKAMVKGEIGSDSIELKNRVVIEVHTNSYRSIRGRSVLAAIFDEVSFWRDERSQNPDTEVHGAIAPGLARVAGSMLIMISSTHRRAGLLYERWRNFYGRDDNDVLVVRGTTRQFNPQFDQRVIDAAIAEDPQRFHAEYNSEWRDDLTTFLSRELLEAAIDAGVPVRPPAEGVVYRAFGDSSGARKDSFTTAIAHRELHNGAMRVVVDLVYERRAPFNPSEVVAEIVALLRRYKISSITGDDYGGELVAEHFRKHGIEYHRSKRDKSEIYLEFMPLMRSGEVRLLDHARAIAQFAGLARRTLPGGKDRVDHETNGHDDIANSVAGAVVLASADREQRVPFTKPIVMTNSNPTGADPSGASPTAEQQQAAADGSRLEETRHRLTRQRDELERERKRCADDVFTNPAARAQLDELITKQAAVDAELQMTRAALAKAAADNPGQTTTELFLQSGAGNSFGGLRWGPI